VLTRRACRRRRRGRGRKTSGPGQILRQIAPNMSQESAGPGARMQKKWGLEMRENNGRCPTRYSDESGHSESDRTDGRKEGDTVSKSVSQTARGSRANNENSNATKQTRRSKGVQESAGGSRQVVASNLTCGDQVRDVEGTLLVDAISDVQVVRLVARAVTTTNLSQKDLEITSDWELACVLTCPTADPSRHRAGW